MRLRRRTKGDSELEGLLAGEDPAEGSEPGETGEGGAAAAHARTGVNRTVWVMAIVAVLSLAAGVILSRFVISPAQAAAEAEPPAAGPITVPVESRVLSSDIVARGDALYDDAVSVTLETGDLGGPAVVTGAVPVVGAEVAAGGVILEVTGRPVIVLPGELPVYRTMRVGVSGPDVQQLQAALNSLGIDAGTSGTYDAQTASAVEALFARAGYPAPAPPEGASEALTSAEDSVRSAEDNLAQANAALTEAKKGATQAERVSADNAVNSAQRALDSAKACVNAPATVDPDTGLELPKDCPSVADAEDALRLAKAQRDETLAAPDTSSQVSMRDAAQRSLDDANATLAQARLDVLTPLPASEVAFVSNLPRRVDSVSVQRGSIVSGEVMTISGATLEIVADISDADAALVTVGATATMVVGDATLAATVVEINATPTKTSNPGDGSDTGQDTTNDGRTELVLNPVDLTEEQRSQIVGMNVRITIPVSSTNGEVMAVPVAALTAGAGGETRVEVMRPGADTPELVVVTTGLSADGYAEITSADGELEVGDLVVVGQSNGTAGEDESAASESESASAEG